MALNLEKQLRFATNTPPLLPLPSFLTIKYLPLNLGTLAALSYSILYVLLEPIAGTLSVPFILGFAALGTYLTSSASPISPTTANLWALAIHIVSWIAQFVGHGKFEGRAPALLDNIVQAVFLAPLFVWLEVLFEFGYRPELKRRLDSGVKEDVERFRREKRKGKQANGHT
ncbi:MAG: hypothetical protein Q9227_006174 [Pyrenula ochraceoflavens]